jgi:peptide/nickel transport system permease protein
VCSLTGVALGTMAGYFGGVVDEVIMRVVDILLAFPGILLNLAIVAVVKRPGVGVMVFAIALNGWVGYARVARGQVLSLRELEFVSAARAMGAGPFRIMRRHILPNLLSPLLVQMTFGLGGAILVEASLSFLGLGPQLPYSWGTLLDQGTGQLWTTQRLATVPGLAILVVVLGSNLLGDGLRDRWDPRRPR